MPRFSPRPVLLLAAASAAVATYPVSAHRHAQATAPATPPVEAPQKFGSWGLDRSAMDPAVDPGDDFFQYVNGSWLENFEIPADRTNYGSFTALGELSEARVRAIVTAAGLSSDPQMKKIADYYGAFTDRAAIDHKGLAPAAADLAAIDAARSHEDIARLMGNVRMGTASIFSPGIYLDFDDNQTRVLHISHSGLGLPNRDFYGEKHEDTKAAYQTHIANMLRLSGHQDAEGAARRIVSLETAMAEHHWPMTKMRDLRALYNPTDRQEFVRSIEGFPWEVFSQELGLPATETLVINQPDAMANLARLFAATDVATWRDYLRYHYLTAHAAVLPEAFLEENFAFFGTRLGGMTQMAPVWRRGVEATSASLGDAIGREYVQQYFPPDAKAQMEALIGNLKEAWRIRIEANEWMSDATKAEALAKLQGFRAYIGYPEKWRDYSQFEVSPTDAFGNLQRARSDHWRFELAQFDEPVDAASEWGMLPTEVNAYYSPLRNAIYFPAAILQAPYFDPAADPAINYGGIGAVIGHEIGHGFDDQGRKTDGKGKLRDWWAPEDAELFGKRTKRLGAQYATYEPLPGMPLDPDFTMGENVGDLAGVAVALDAYKLSLGGTEAPVIDGFTGVQRFFLSYGQIWRRKHTEADMRMRISHDPHSPSEFRVNGIVRNMDDWYRAFNVTPDDDLYLAPGDRVRIW